MRFRQVPGRKHEERPVRTNAVSIGSLAVSVTLKPFEELPDGVHLEAVLEELGGIVADATDSWYKDRGHVFCVAAPSIT